METEKEVTEGTGTAAARYAQLSSDRNHFIDRAHECAKLTLPTLFQKNTTLSQNLKIVDPAQSLGARGVNNLSAKMGLSTMPLNTPFYKFSPDTLEIPDEGLLKEVKKGLNKLERGLLGEIEASGDVVGWFEGLKHLCVVGNVLLYLGEDGLRLYNLNKYVVHRDPSGKVMEIVICEDVSPMSLPEEIRAEVEAANATVASVNNTDRTVKLYTHVKFVDGRVKWHQEVNNTVLPDSDSDVPEDGNPWLALRFMRVDGEDYGRSYVEMYLGDLQNLELLTAAVTDASIAAAKVLFLVRPNGQTNPKVLNEAPNMAVRSGHADDVTVLRLDKAADLSVAKSMIDAISQRLAYAFLINAEVMRDAERVTAEEVRFVAQELDDSLGGIYSLLSKEFQLPYVKRRMHLMLKKTNVPKLPDEVKPVIVTGYAALGKGHDLEKMNRFIAGVNAYLENPELQKFISADEYIARLAVSLGIDTKDLVIDEKVRQKNIADEQQQQQGSDLLGKLGPSVIREAGSAMAQQPQTPTQQPA